jgi:hypothetical protein
MSATYELETIERTGWSFYDDSSFGIGIVGRKGSIPGSSVSMAQLQTFIQPSCPGLVVKLLSTAFLQHKTTSVFCIDDTEDDDDSSTRASGLLMIWHVRVNGRHAILCVASLETASLSTEKYFAPATLVTTDYSIKHGLFIE